MIKINVVLSNNYIFVLHSADEKLIDFFNNYSNQLSLRLTFPIHILQKSELFNIIHVF